MNTKSKKNDYTLILLISISIILLGYSAIYLINYYSNNNILIYFPESVSSDGKKLNPNEIGDTIGGILNPIIGFTASILTFLAFYIQFKANKQQKELFRQELDSNKFESQFYEMLRLHKENVNEINIKLTFDSKTRNEIHIQTEDVSGRECFKYFLEELKIIYFVAKKSINLITHDKAINIAYSIFFHGIGVFINKPIYTKEEREFYEILKSLEYINDGNRNIGTRGNKHKFNDYVSEKSNYYGAKVLNYDLFQGHSANLAHYYRHLYQTVKFIANQNDQFLTYEQKRNYLRILRSQLSNQEQAMLFYNWKSDFGHGWQNKTNKYFTDYRMIHNLYNDLLISDFDLKVIFDIENLNYKKEINRTNDSLFEFQDWSTHIHNDL
ncbi:putative phage abortive infection protein [Mariniflexile litorale]|uniref:Phage abortive infection protein n=1 Tax=Mariniflexile litorale TaxID=3045158 RepID=A0AAU7EAW7_9FLAO|nr:putative phage abortive infection protein [Mariniflexile sp. KMM 9835]MDQ8210358.1 putative phage abortive infection protein [Mariniflexile sp. KMM 9835]